MWMESVTKNTAIVFIFALLMFSQTAVAVASSQYIEEVTDETFEEKVYKSRKPTIVFFTIDNNDSSSGDARALFENIREAYSEKINYFKYNLGKITIDEINLKKDELFEKYGVWTIPSIYYGSKKYIIGVYSTSPLEGEIKEDYEASLLCTLDPKLVPIHNPFSLNRYKKFILKGNTGSDVEVNIVLEKQK